MKTKLVIWLSGKPIALLGLVLLASLAAACGGEGEEKATAGATGTAAARPTGTAAAPTEQVPGITPTEIILGAHGTLSGMGAVNVQVPDSMRAYYKYVNEEKGGVCGRKITLKVEDDAGDPAKGLEAIRKLVERDKVFAMAGSMGDLVHAAVWGYLNEKGIPDLLVLAGGHRYSSDPEGHPWTIQMLPDFTVEGSFFGRYISQNLPGKKVAVLWQNDDLGRDGLAGVKKGLDPSKNELVSEQGYDVTAIDIRPQLLAMKEAGAEVVVLYSSIGYTVQALKGADRMGWHPEFLASYVNADASLFQLFVPPKLAAGLVTFNALKTSEWKDDPAVAEHYRIMSKYGGPPPTTLSLFGQVVAELVVDILGQSCDNLTREGVMKAATSVGNWRSGLLVEGATVTITEKDRLALDRGRMERVIEENGKGRWEYFGELWEFHED